MKSLCVELKLRRTEAHRQFLFRSRNLSDAKSWLTRREIFDGVSRREGRLHDFTLAGPSARQSASKVFGWQSKTFAVDVVACKRRGSSSSTTIRHCCERNFWGLVFTGPPDWQHTLIEFIKFCITNCIEWHTLVNELWQSCKRYFLEKGTLPSPIHHTYFEDIRTKNSPEAATTVETET